MHFQLFYEATFRVSLRMQLSVPPKKKKCTRRKQAIIACALRFMPISGQLKPLFRFTRGPLPPCGFCFLSEPPPFSFSADQVGAALVLRASLLGLKAFRFLTPALAPGYDSPLAKVLLSTSTASESKRQHVPLQTACTWRQGYNGCLSNLVTLKLVSGVVVWVFRLSGFALLSDLSRRAMQREKTASASVERHPLNTLTR